MTEPKRIDIKEFREEGVLQEANRRFFHPLGLALEVQYNEETGEERLAGVWDCRDDPEGIHYNLSNSDNERIERFRRNRDNIESKFKYQNRLDRLGFTIEPIPENKGEE